MNETVRILVVDDETLMRHAFRRALAIEGYEVLEAADGFAAVQILDDIRPDLILTDLGMPGMDGFELIRHTAAKTPDIPIIAVSGTGDIQAAIAAIRQGAWDYISKPLAAGDELLIVVQQALERAGLLAENREYREHLEMMVASRTHQLKESEERFRISAEQTGQVVYEYDVRSGKIAWAGAIEHFTGYDTDAFEQFDAAFWNDHIHPDDRDQALSALENAIARGLKYERSYRFRRNNGQYIIVDDRGIAIKDGIHADHLIGVLEDVTERKTTENERLKLATAIDCSSDWILISDINGSIEYVNKAVEEMSGYTRNELIGRNPRVFKSGKHDDAFYRNMWKTILSGETCRSIMTNRRKNGELFEVFHTITPLKDPAGTITHFIATSKDLSHQKELETRLHHLANYDALTELPNRSLFIDRLSQCLMRSSYQNRLTAVLLIDIDRFGAINDTYGFEAGDLVLREVARRLSATVRAGDTVARVGNDNFGIILAEVAETDDLVMIDNLMETVSAPVSALGKEIMVTLCMGVSVCPTDGTDAMLLIKNADLALKKASEKGRNNYQFYAEGMERKVADFIHMEKSLFRAIRQEEFVVHYQPYWDIASRKIVGMEALVRWQSPEHGLVSPGRFIPVLEDTGMIVEVGEWILQTAAGQIRKWIDQGVPVVPVSVNLSLIQFRQHALSDCILDAVRHAGISPAQLVLEVTESAFMEDVGKTEFVLKRLHAAGFSISIDDFGTGYSSLSYLKRFPVTNLKIDISFIREIAADPDTASIVMAIIGMAHTLGMKTIAEGIETEEQWKTLRLLRCDVGQGFLMYRPLPADRIGQLLRHHT